MRFLAALALLVLSVANAHHTPEHKLGYPKFVPDRTHLYHVTLNMTAGVPGMHSQVSKAVIQMELKIYAKNERELVLQMHKVFVSDSLPSVGSETERLTLKRNNALEELLKLPFTAIYENGKVTSYSLSDRETLESQKIKRSILRNLEIYLDTEYLQSDESQKFWPITYNVTRNSAAGQYSSHYVVTSSPFPDFPKELNVFNISRTDNFEVVPYLAYRTHHNFAKQGCSEVCKKDHIENRYGAGCPIGHESYHSPIKRSFVQHHNLKKLEDSRILIIDSVRTEETHVANVYDQNMQVTIRTSMRFKIATPQPISVPTGQKMYQHLEDYSKEINEPEIEELCKHPNTGAAKVQVEKMLDEISEVIMKDDLKEEKSKQIGEMLITLQKAMQRLQQGDLRSIDSKIVQYHKIGQASDKEKIVRQVWLDLLPVVGTPESVSFIVHLIQANINVPNKGISLWEAKTILEALPQNIHRPDQQTITQLSQLLEHLKERDTTGYTLYYSAAYMTVARIIHNLCATHAVIPEDRNSASAQQSLSARYLRSARSSELEKNAFSDNMVRKCPKTAALQFIKEINLKLKSTNDRAKRVIYIEALARTGLEEALRYLRPYVYGQSSQWKSEYKSQSYVDYLKTIAIYALHNVVDKSPRAVQDLVFPVFLNETEPPKVRTAAFSVLIKSQPTLGVLQHIAEQSWREPSEEVGSYVSSTLHTYGNSSQPCYKLTAYRIKKILPQLRRIDHGQQKAKNILWDLWDEVRGFGFEKRLDFTPSNESFIPSVVYGALGYNVDSLKDYLFQYSLNAQGLTSRNLYDTLLRRLGLTPAEDIPEDAETLEKIFPHLTVVSRDPEFWRLTAYQRLFYSTSYYYTDAKDSKKSDIYDMVVDYLKNYISRDSQGQLSGHLVKVFIPSSYHAKTISQALAYPVSFEMKNPLLLSLKLKVKQITGQSLQESSGIGCRVHFEPSVYSSTVYTNEITNLGDCKKVGVYHVQKIAASYPVVMSFLIKSNNKFTWSYKLPQLPKQIFSYRSEAGTYAGKSHLTPLPLKEEMRTIKTIPSLFVQPLSLSLPALPRFVGQIKSEDIQFGMEDIPRNPEEAALQFVKHYLNAGWRRKSVDISRVEDGANWPSDNEVKIHLDFSRDYVTPEKKALQADWKNELNFDDKLDKEDTNAYVSEGKHIYNTLSLSMDHIKDSVKMVVEQRARENDQIKFNLDYYHTLGGFLHLVHFKCSAKTSITADYAMSFTETPNEFKYTKQHYGKQKGLSIGAISFSEAAPFQNPAFIAKAVFNYKPLHQVLKLESSVDAKEYEPETHLECLDDVEEGKSHSAACVKAIREKSIYNHLKLHGVWFQEAPRPVMEIVEMLDLALKHAFYTHLEVTKKSNVAKSLRLEATYIDKMTDEPVVDVKLYKPSEILWFSRVSVGKFRPISSIESVVESYAASMTNNSYPATCVMMDKYVRTYDLMTYEMPSRTKECTYVLSTHCTERKKFAVLVQHSGRSHGSKEVHIHVGKDEIVLVPGSRTSYQVRYNGEEKTAAYLKPLMLNKKELITAYVMKLSDGSSYVEINAWKAGVMVRYNGVHVKVQVHPRYKGELCGLCSEFNGEIVREFRGVDRCLYTDEVDFFKSSVTDNCYSTEVKGSDYMCDDGKVHRSPRKEEDEDRWQQIPDEIEGDVPKIKRNVVLSQGSKVCFSTQPVPVCENSAEPMSTEPRQVDFHCLPKQDINARKMVTESKRRMLGELETKPVDHTETIEVAKMC